MRTADSARWDEAACKSFSVGSFEPVILSRGFDDLVGIKGIEQGVGRGRNPVSGGSETPDPSGPCLDQNIG